MSKCYKFLESKLENKEKGRPELILSKEIQDLKVNKPENSVMVVSAIGAQKAGKSTLLKNLYGIDFKSEHDLYKKTTEGCDCNLNETEKHFNLTIDSEGYRSIVTYSKLREYYPAENPAEIEQKYSLKYGSFIFAVSDVILYCLRNIPQLDELKIFTDISKKASELSNINQPCIIFVCISPSKQHEEAYRKNIADIMKNAPKVFSKYEVCILPQLIPPDQALSDVYINAIKELKLTISNECKSKIDNNMNTDKNIGSSWIQFLFSANKIIEQLENDFNLMSAKELNKQLTQKGKSKAIELYEAKNNKNVVLSPEQFALELQKCEICLQKENPNPDLEILEEMKITIKHKYKEINKRCTKMCSTNNHQCKMNKSMHISNKDCNFNCTSITKTCVFCLETKSLPCNQAFEIPHLVNKKCSKCNDTRKMPCNQNFPEPHLP